MSAPRDGTVAEAVRRGLTAARKSLPPFLFYDTRGSELFEEITRLPEYYLTRTERSILEKDAAKIVRELVATTGGPFAVFELGAGTAVKTELLLRAFVDVIGTERAALTYFPADVSRAPLESVAKRLASSLPALRVSPIIGTHAEALVRVASWVGPALVVFLGSSIGNYDDADASRLLSNVRRAVGTRGALLLGVDRVKPLDVLLPAYSDAAGVTAAFNRNVLARINRELDASFDLEAFEHVTVWNEAASAVEMHLESAVRQRVDIGALGLAVHFGRGERIHTESSHKYTDDRVRGLFERAGLARIATFEDERRWFALHIARAP